MSAWGATGGSRLHAWSAALQTGLPHEPERKLVLPARAFGTFLAIKGGDSCAKHGEQTRGPERCVAVHTCRGCVLSAWRWFEEGILESELLKDEVVGWLFTSIRNAGLVAVVVWVSAELYERPAGFGERTLSMPVMLAGLFLMVVNAMWGFRKLLESTLSRRTAWALGVLLFIVLSATVSVSFRIRLGHQPVAPALAAHGPTPQPADTLHSRDH